MTILTVISMSAVSLLLLIYQWKTTKGRKEQWASVILTGAAWITAVLLYLYPELPGPSHLVNAVFKPLGPVITNQP